MPVSIEIRALMPEKSGAGALFAFFDGVFYVCQARARVRGYRAVGFGRHPASARRAN